MNQNYVLSCCSTADLSAEHFSRRDIHYVCFHFQLGEQWYPDDCGKSVPFERFYREMAAGVMTRTSQVNSGEYRDYFETFLREGRDILHVTLSSGLSGSYNAAMIARGELAEKYPERRIFLVDSLGASSGYGLLMDRLADLRDGGMELEALADWAEQHRLHVAHWFFSTTLEYYVRGGRISRAAGVFGGLLNICPLLNMDREGKLIVRSKCRGKSRVIREIVERMKRHAEGGAEYSGKCYLSQSACMEDARAVADAVEAAFPRLDGRVEINSIGTTIGSHTGPGTVALFFFGDTREDDAASSQ